MAVFKNSKEAFSTRQSALSKTQQHPNRIPSALSMFPAVKPPEVL
jgi:hypothetical protein